MNDTTIFLIRHAKKNSNITYLIDKEETEKDLLRPLSAIGIQQAQKIAELSCLKNVSVIFSSEFLRAIMTAIPLSEMVRCNIQITNAFNERLRQKASSLKMSENFHVFQMMDAEYRMPGGESRSEVCSRLHNGIIQILERYPGKQIAVFSHKTAITMFLMQYCDYQIKQDVYLSYNGNIVFNGKWDGSPEIFKMTFRNTQLIAINKIRNECM